MATKIGVNGFGRIGRYLTRILADDKNYEIAVINARAGNEELARLLKYDSVHRTFPGEVGVWEDGITVQGKKIHVNRHAACEWKWGDYGIDIVVDTTGKFTDREKAGHHMTCGAKKVIVSAPAKEPDCTIVMGVNDHEYDPAKHNIISSASCTTNCLAPVAKALNDAFGIKHGLMTTIHSYTMSQRILDGSHKDPRRARAACVSLIPTTTGAARAVTAVMPELKGKLDGYSIRVPTADGSIVDLTCEMAKPVTKEEVNALLKSKANENMGYTEEPLVSVDYLGDTHGGVVDGLLTTVLDGTLLKVVIWYDNEAGFTHQLIRLLNLVATKK
ncbi:MAG: type I glyceraldehyde-3-phosphate dehydrogenase [Desulfovibrio sp.]|jgi:glyceraldehyde 3-phosphate dehydrogenase|nr:type I glyceraldehyde-3-phosphate dehydrogenase [Desulfovibrio sp.]MBI4961184.1 type I glyceraldehyde-3-phosphate dehydrogenase [Desulfovibrio sp.]